MCKRYIDCLPLACPHLGTWPATQVVRWLGIKPGTFWFMGWHWATPVRAGNFLLFAACYLSYLCVCACVNKSECGIFLNAFLASIGIIVCLFPFILLLQGMIWIDLVLLNQNLMESSNPSASSLFTNYLTLHMFSFFLSQSRFRYTSS